MRRSVFRHIRMQGLHDLVRQAGADHGTFGGRDKHFVWQGDVLEEVFPCLVFRFGRVLTEFIVILLGSSGATVRCRNASTS